MAEEELNYQINFDEADLSQKLDRIRTQIDFALGQSAFQDLQIPLAGSLPFSGAATNPVQAASMGNVQPGFAGPLPDNFSAAQDQSFWGGVTSFLDSSAQNIQLGFDKFTNDMRRIGLIQQPQFPAFDMSVARMQGPSGFGSSLLALGFPGMAGFDPAAGTSVAEFQSQAAGNVTDTMARFTANNAFSMLGAAAGGIVGGFPGAWLGLSLGAGADMMGSLLSGRSFARDEMANALQEIAEQSFGPISSGASNRMAAALQDRVFSFGGRATGLDIDQIQRNVAGFAEAGGFNQVRSADEMQDVLMGVVDNAREFANNFNMAQDEAVRVMAQLEQRLITTSSEAGAFSARIGSLAENFGMNPGAVAGLGLQGAEMVRGTGITANQGFNLMMQSRAQVERMLRSSDPLTRQIMADFASPQQAAIAAMETSSRFMQSGQGMFHTGAVLGGFGGIPGADTSFGGLLTGFADYIGQDPANLIGLPAVSPMVAGDMSLQEQQLRMVGMYADILRNMGMTNSRGQVSEDALAGLLMSQAGLSRQDAITAIQSVQTGFGDPRMAAGREALAMWQSTAESNRIGVMGQISGFLGEVGDALVPQELGDFWLNMRKGAEDTFEDITDWFIGRERFRFEGVDNAEIANYMRNYTSIGAYRNLNMSPTGEIKKEVAKDFINSMNKGPGWFTFRGSSNIKLTEEYEDLFSEYSFGLTNSEKRKLLGALASRQARGRDHFRTEADLVAIRQWQSTGNLSPEEQQLADQIERDKIDGADLNGLAGIKADQSLSILFDSISREIFDTPFESLNDIQRQAMRSITNRNARLQNRIDQGVLEYRDVNLASADEARGLEEAKLQTAISIQRDEINFDMFDITREDVSNLVNRSGIPSHKLNADPDYFGNVILGFQNRIESGDFNTYADILTSIHGMEDSDNKRLLLNYAKGDLLRKAGGGENLNVELDRIQKLKALEQTAMAENQVQEMTDFISSSLIDSGLGRDERMQIEDATRKLMISGAITGEDVTMFRAHLPRDAKKRLIEQIGERFAEAEKLTGIQAQQAQVANLISDGMLTRFYTNKGQFDKANQLQEQFIKSGDPTTRAMQMFLQSFDGNALRVRPITKGMLESDS